MITTPYRETTQIVSRGKTKHSVKPDGGKWKKMITKDVTNDAVITSSLYEGPNYRQLADFSLGMPQFLQTIVRINEKSTLRWYAVIEDRYSAAANQAKPPVGTGKNCAGFIYAGKY